MAVAVPPGLAQAQGSSIIAMIKGLMRHSIARCRRAAARAACSPVDAATVAG
jgi:hypothetical protein